jgi:AcrR family transcriptional regulator
VSSGNVSGDRQGDFWSGFDVLWGLVEQPVSRTPLDRDQIVAAAIALADREGLDGVSMRRVAAKLGRGAMSLYRHVPDKDALVSMMVEAILAEALAGQTSDFPRSGWREGLRMVARETWRTCRAHPWYPLASMTRPPLTPSGVAGLELALSLFDGFPLDIGTKMQFVGAVHFSVLSAALNTTLEEQALSRAKMSDEEVMAAARPFMRQMIESGKFPRVAEFVANADQHEAGTDMWNGVEIILDGIGARLSLLGSEPSKRRARSPKGPPSR